MQQEEGQGLEVYGRTLLVSLVQCKNNLLSFQHSTLLIGAVERSPNSVTHRGEANFWAWPSSPLGTILLSFSAEASLFLLAAVKKSMAVGRGEENSSN